MLKEKQCTIRDIVAMPSPLVPSSGSYSLNRNSVIHLEIKHLSMLLMSLHLLKYNEIIRLHMRVSEDNNFIIFIYNL